MALSSPPEQSWIEFVIDWRRNPDAFEIRELDAPVITDHHVFNVATPIDKRADLSACFV